MPNEELVKRIEELEKKILELEAGRTHQQDVIPDAIKSRHLDLTDGIKIDTISEKTSAEGVTIDGVKLKDSEPYCDVINEKTSATGVTIDGVLLKDDNATLDEISAKTASTPVKFNDAHYVAEATYTPDAAGTATLDVSQASIHKITMPAGNITIAISNETNGQCFLIEITQDGTGSRTVTWFSTIKWAGGSAPTLTTTGNKRDTFGFRVTGTDTYDAFIVGQNV